MGEPAYLAQAEVNTTCPYCGVGCGISVSPKKTINTLKGFEVKVVGDKNHPANFGKLCVKGSATGETVNYGERMLHPQINGEQVDWETALTTVADKFKQVIAEHGSDSVAFYVSGQFLTEDYYVANKLIKGFMGTANIDTNSRLCMASAVVGYKRAFGSDTVPCSYEDLEKADLITLVGSNAAWAHPIVYQRIAAAKKARPDMKIVVVDPRKTATCDIADLHLPIKPGMDAALFNGLLAYLAQNDKLDKNYIEHYTEGFDVALAKANELQGDLARLAEQCDLDLADLESWLDWSANTQKMVTFYSQGVNQSSSGVDKSNAIINCHLATGRIGKEGMGPFSITGQPNAMGGREVGGLANQLAAHMDFNKPENIDLVSRFWQAENMAQENGLKAVDMFKAVGKGKIKAIWIMNSNPVVSMPDADAVKKALEACDFVVVQDCVQNTDTTLVGNVLLPATTWGEASGTVTNSERRISLQRQFMTPPENARPDWWILSEVAKKMGWEKHFNYRSAADIFREHAQLSAFENNGRRDFDISSFANISDSEYQNLVPVQWPVNAKNPQGTKRMFVGNQFFTPSKKAQFIEITPIAPLSKASKKYPLVLNTGRVRDQWHTMTRTAKTAKLMAHKDEPYVSIHPKDALKYGIKKGELAKVKNQLGYFLGRVDVSENQRCGDLFVPMHWTGQYSNKGRIDALVVDHVDPLSGQPESKHSVVSIEPLKAKWHGFILTKQELSNEVLETLDYWVKIMGSGYVQYEIACLELPKSPQEWASKFLPNQREMIQYNDEAGQRYRIATLDNNCLETILFMAPSIDLPNRSWLGSIFKANEIDAITRLSLLAGKASGAKDEGKTVCSCFGVGINTIIESIHKNKLTNVEQIGQCLKAGTNCGSCIPELTDILVQELK
jgi:assimilatory nitrate reductase catalytic subunit